jgi:hypothetical protein
MASAVPQVSQKDRRALAPEVRLPDIGSETELFNTRFSRANQRPKKASGFTAYGKLIGKGKKCQGTTSVVPIPPNKGPGFWPPRGFTFTNLPYQPDAATTKPALTARYTSPIG